MPKISQLSAGIPTTDNTELIAAVQNGVTVKLTLAQALALAQPFNDNLDDIAALAGEGYPYRDALGAWSLQPIAGIAGPVGPPGPAGLDGAPGPQGPVGPAGSVTGYIVRIDSTASPYTPSDLSQVVLIDATLPVVIELPEITLANNGVQYNLKITAGTGVTVNAFNNADGTDKIDGANTVTIVATYDNLTIVASYDAGGNSFWSVL